MSSANSFSLEYVVWESVTIFLQINAVQNMDREPLINFVLNMQSKKSNFVQEVNQSFDIQVSLLRSCRQTGTILFADAKPFPKQALDFMCLQFQTVENTVGKGEIARHEQFLLFSQCFLPV